MDSPNVKYSGGKIVPHSDLREGTTLGESKNRLKILIWNTKRHTIKEIRKLFKIDNKLLMRERGLAHLRRIEIWFQTRTEAKQFFNENKQKAKFHNFHISLGSTFKERKNKREQYLKDKTTNTNKITLKILQWNARSLRNKIELLKQDIQEKNPQIVCIQESFLSDNVINLYKFKNFKILNLSRPERRGGGVITMIHESIHIIESNSEIKGHIEFISTKILLPSKQTLYIINVYIPPGLNLNAEDLDQLVTRKRNFIILGDFNSKHPYWNDGPPNHYGNILYNWILHNNLILLNDGKIQTYQCANTGSTSTLDLCLCSSDLYDHFCNWKIGEDLSSDHLPVYTTFSFTPNYNTQENALPRTKWKIKSANWSTFTKAIHIDYNIYENLNLSQNIIDSKTLEITDILINAAKQSIPIIKQKTNKPLNIWWNENLSNERKKKQHARKKWMKYRTTENKIAYNKAKAILRKNILAAKRTNWQKFVSSMNPNTPSSTVWKRFKAIKGNGYETIPHLRNSTGTIITNEFEKAELLNEYYSGKLNSTSSWPHYMNKEEQYLTSNFELLFFHKDITDTSFTAEELQLALLDLHDSATGEDDIHNAMLQNSTVEFLKLILSHFNNIWKTGHYPNIWKNSIIIPILKPKKDKLDCKSYRPISLTSCLSKLLERMVHRRLSWRLEKFNLLSPFQFGFRPACSTVDAVLYIAQDIYSGFQEKQTTVAITIDFEAAFDSVPHKSIMLQSMKIGIRGKMLHFLQSFLQNRTIQTSINNHLSHPKSISSGIPQGSVLSPTLFNIMLHDLPNVIPSKVKISIYADDVTIWCIDENPDEAVVNLQTAINNINNWANKWNLTISQSKTKCTVFTRRYSLKDYRPFIMLNGKHILYDENPKILGITFDEKLLWNTHIQNLATQCLSRINLLKIIANKQWGSDIATMRLFYIAYIRSKLTYGCEIWGGAAATHINKISVIQNTALRLCLGVPKTTPINAMEIELNVMPIQQYIHKRIWTKHMKIKTSSRCNIFFEAGDSNMIKYYKLPNDQAPIKLEDITLAKTPVINDIPPWNWKTPEYNLSIPGNYTKSASEYILKASTIELISEKYHNHLQIYTDGSLNCNNGDSGAGFYIPQTKESYYISSTSSSSLDTELLAIEAALLHIQQTPSIDMNICILTDSMSAIQNLIKYMPTPYAHRIIPLQNKILELNRIGKNVIFQWIPSHCGILGNERADMIAKFAANLQPKPQIDVPLTAAIASLNSYYRNVWTEIWLSSNKGKNLQNIMRKPNDLKLYHNIPRHLQTFATRARTGHIVTQSYLYRFHLSDSPICLLCNREEETLEHILLHCSTINPTRNQLKNSVSSHQNPMYQILETPSLWTTAAAVYNEHLKKIKEMAVL